MSQYAIQFCFEETDFIIRSVAAGICEKCGQSLVCRNGCYSPADYTGDTASNIALEKGECAICGKKVVCPRGHLGGDELKASVHLANVALRATGLYGDFQAPALVKRYDGDTRLTEVVIAAMPEIAVKAACKKLSWPKGVSMPGFRKHKTKAREPWLAKDF